MKTTNLTLAVDSEKLAALRQYAAKRSVKIDTELTDAIEKLYEKHVPAAVREFISERELANPARQPRPPRSSTTQAADSE